MGRLPRPTGDDLIYHAINRGSNRADVLGPDGERDMFLGDLARTKARYPFALFGYCLMSNHFHLLLKPAPGQSISRILQSLTVAHTWRHHRRQGTSGHVWQSRFRSPVVQDGDHVLVVLRYIEANPVRAAMVADPCEYTWSSHRCHGAGHADRILDSFPEWEQLGRTEPERRARWRRKVRGEQPAKELDGVRSSVRSGRPYGAEDWVEVISHRLGIVREPRRRGRPPREKMLRHRNSPPTVSGRPANMTEPSTKSASKRVSRLIKVPRRPSIRRSSIGMPWLLPETMTGRVHTFGLREGGAGRCVGRSDRRAISVQIS